MRLQDAIGSIQKQSNKRALAPLYTPWGEAIKQSQTQDVWQEYPRPALRRKHFKILNGMWNYAICAEKKNAAPEKSAAAPALGSHPVPGTPIRPDGQILVPYSPETLLSGVHRQLSPNEILWYERTISFSEEDLSLKEAGMRCILRFDAVDQDAIVYVNGKELISHRGGYLPFFADMTEYISENELLLQVRVRDVSDTSYRTRGKQTLKRSGMWYTAQSGIWQSVWYEWVPANYIRGLEVTPDIESGSVQIKLQARESFSSISCTVYKADAAYTTEHLPDTPIGVNILRDDADPNTITLVLPEEEVRLWTPEKPYLYGITLMADDDTVKSYFALRSFGVEPDEKGVMRFCLNHRPYFLHGLLDQGYWSDSLMTAPCDEALIYDIQLAKDTGFNMLRKHIKIEPLRWYYHCDRLGMIVWQDMVNGGGYNAPLMTYLPTVFPNLMNRLKDNHYKLLSRADEAGRKEWEQECLDTVAHLYNVPSLAVWVPFNEGWGQFDALRITDLIMQKDPTRPVDHASGWFDQKGGSFNSVHNYFRKLTALPDKERAFVISEYGGYACHIEGHSSVPTQYGYKTFADTQALSKAYHELVEDQLFTLIDQGLSGAVYTQLSDVEEETNGLVTYDRRVVKIH